MSKILITGAAGNIGQGLVKHLQAAHELTLVDIDFSEFPLSINAPHQLVTRDLTQLADWRDLLTDIEYVIQLAGNPDREAKWDELINLNYVLPYNLFQAATESPALKRIIFASSIHASEGYPDDVQIKVEDQNRPDSLYGLSKLYLENLAHYFAYAHNIESIGIRIGDYKLKAKLDPSIMDAYGRAEYLSENDMNHLIDCCLQAELVEPHLIVNGISNNTFKRLNIESARQKLNYHPQDNAFEL